MFGDYALLEEIGRGGMGVVYRARHRGLDRLVALKMIIPSRLTSAKDLQRFRLEAETAAHLEHPHILPIYEVGEIGGQPYYTAKLLDSGSLTQQITERKTVKDRVRLFLKVCQAVAYAHIWRHAWQRIPARVEGIPVQQEVRKLHVLHGTACTEPSVEEGAEIARFVWHYDTGTEESPVFYGQDVRHWWWRPEDAVGPTSARSRVVWTGSNPIAREQGYQLRLYLTTIENPRPQELVKSLDYVSAMSDSAPFLIALTVE